MDKTNMDSVAKNTVKIPGADERCLRCLWGKKKIKRI